jgi:hypothetical protein
MVGQILVHASIKLDSKLCKFTVLTKIILLVFCPGVKLNTELLNFGTEKSPDFAGHVFMLLGIWQFCRLPACPEWRSGIKGMMGRD